jgi:hypothetical protein
VHGAKRQNLRFSEFSETILVVLAEEWPKTTKIFWVLKNAEKRDFLMFSRYAVIHIE